MAIHKFTVTLKGAPPITPELQAAMDRAGCGDAVLHYQSRPGVTLLDFEREAPTFDDALITAIAQIRRAEQEIARWNRS